MLQRARYLLSRQITSRLVIATSIGARLLQLLYFFNLRSDRSFQLLATDNLVRGHGVSLAEVQASDLSHSIYSTLIKWPPGYSLLTAPLYAIDPHQYAVTALLLDMIAAIILIVSGRGILRQLNVAVELVNLFTLSTAFYIYDFYFISSTDAIAISAFAAGLYFLIRLVKTRTGWYGAAFTVCMLLTGLLKYLFIPVMFVVPHFLILKGFADRRDFLKKTAVVSLFLLALSLALVLVYQKKKSGSAVYVSAGARGLYPENLLSSYPFLPAALVKPETIERVTSIRTPILTGFYQLLQITGLLLILIFLLTLLRRSFWRLLEDPHWFATLSLLLMLVNYLVLAALSLTVARTEETPGVFWTFVQEPRYYGLAIVLLHLLLFLGAGRLLQHRIRFTRPLLIVTLMLLLPEAIRGMIFTVNRAVHLGREEYSWQYDLRLQRYGQEVIDKARREQHINKVAVTASLYYIANRIALYSQVPLFNEVNLVKQAASLHTTKPVLLLTVLLEQDLKAFENFTTDPANRAAGHFDQYYFFVTPLLPEIK
ncbi:MAG TPA: hypothetical protein VHK91_02165 [Flavisolibacter sp.]|jgi:hypothetical protein|nr:hypothetical protein [Flavisolibacter sp.]